MAKHQEIIAALLGNELETETYYVRRKTSGGRYKYYPVSVAERHNARFGLRDGYHLVICRPGSTSYHMNIDPDFASLVAASREAIDEMATEMRVEWEKTFLDKYGNRYRQSFHDIAQAGVNVLIEKAKWKT